MSYYTDNGFNDRNDYLHSLANDFEIDIEVVYMMANMLGENEDFDGLINSLEDFTEIYY